jgi:hypothetical protein
MHEMQVFAIAARLHVVMRRAMGRVTDVEWMIHNRDYAREMIRLARGCTDPELRELADKFESSLDPQQRVAPPARAVSVPQVNDGARELAAPAGAPVPRIIPAGPRYVGGLR